MHLPTLELHRAYLRALRRLYDQHTAPPRPRAPGTLDRARNACAPPEGRGELEELEAAP